MSWRRFAPVVAAFVAFIAVLMLTRTSNSGYNTMTGGVYSIYDGVWLLNTQIEVYLAPKLCTPLEGSLKDLGAVYTDEYGHFSYGGKNLSGWFLLRLEYKEIKKEVCYQYGGDGNMGSIGMLVHTRPFLELVTDKKLLEEVKELEVPIRIKTLGQSNLTMAEMVVGYETWVLQAPKLEVKEGVDYSSNGQGTSLDSLYVSFHASSGFEDGQVLGKLTFTVRNLPRNQGSTIVEIRKNRVWQNLGDLRATPYDSYNNHLVFTIPRPYDSPSKPDLRPKNWGQIFGNIFSSFHLN